MLISKYGRRISLEDDILQIILENITVEQEHHIEVDKIVDLIMAKITEHYNANIDKAREMLE